MVFFNHYCLLTRLLSFACQEALSVLLTTRRAKCLRTLCSYQEVSLCLVSQVTLRSSTFASSIVCLAKSHLRSTTSHICLSQAYGCSDRYKCPCSHVLCPDDVVCPCSTPPTACFIPLTVHLISSLCVPPTRLV